MRTTRGFPFQAVFVVVLYSWCLISKVKAFEVNKDLIQKYFFAANTMSRSLASQNSQQQAFFSAVSSSNSQPHTNVENFSSHIQEQGTMSNFSPFLPAIEGAKGSRSAGSSSKGESEIGSRIKDVNKPPDEQFESLPKKSSGSKKKQKKKKNSESAEDSVSMEKGFRERPLQGGRMLTSSRKSKTEDKKPQSGQQSRQSKPSKTSAQETSEESSSEEISEKRLKVKQEQGHNTKQEKINEQTEELIPISKDLPMMSRVKIKQIERQKMSQFQRQNIEFPLFMNQPVFPKQNLLPMQLGRLG